MKTTGYNKFLVLISIIILLSGAYLYFYEGSKSEAADTSSTSLSSSLDGSSSTTSSSTTSDPISNDTAFLSSLSLLKNIKIDTSIFTNKSFILLKDNNIPLESVTPGRPNPFAPIDTSILNLDNPSVTTEIPPKTN